MSVARFAARSYRSLPPGPGAESIPAGRCILFKFGPPSDALNVQIDPKEHMAAIALFQHFLINPDIIGIFTSSYYSALND